MKKIIITNIFSILILFSSLSASIDFSIEEVKRFAFCQNYFSNTTMVAEPPYMYALTSYGLEIYEIQINGLLQKISGLPIKKSWKFVKRDNYLYIGSHVLSHFDPAPLYVYQVNVSDKYNPYIAQTLEFDNFSEAIIPVLIGDYFIAETFWGTDYIYTIPELELYGTIDDWDMYLQQLNDTLCFNFIQASIFDLYDNTDILNLQYVTTVDMYDIHGGYSPKQFKSINDTIICVSGQTAVSFWNISNPGQWEYISHYVPDEFLQNGTNFTNYENYIILSQFYGLELLDIAEIYNPQYLDYCDFNSSYEYYIMNNNEYIYIGTGKFGMGIYQIENEEIVFIKDYYEYPSFNYSTLIYQNHLFIESTAHGIFIFDVTNPLEPIEITTCLKEAPLRSPVGHDSLIVVHDYDEISIKIYDIGEPYNPILRNTIDGFTLLDWWYSTIRFDDSEPQSMYVSNFNNGNVRKYDIAEPGDCPLLFAYNITNTNTDFIAKDGYGYIFTPETHPQHLYIIGGLNVNNPTIINTIENFSQYTYSPYIFLCGDYLCLRYSADYYETKLYSLDDPENPQIACTLEVPSTNSWPKIYDNLVFTKTHNLSFVYDLNGCNGDTLHYIDYFDGLFMMYGFDFYDVDDKNYLFVTEPSIIGLYEYNYNVGIDDEPEANDQLLCSHPNPFSSSNTISIKFNHPTSLRSVVAGELSKIKIYNIKGQLIKTIISFPNPSLGTHEAVWNGKDESGKEVCAGVYLYKMDDEDGFVGKVVKLR